MNAILPESMADVDRSIASMDIGEQGWTVPWAMYYDDNRQLWLNGAYTLSRAPGGTTQMVVRRDENGWHVDAGQVRADYSWGGGGYVGRFPSIAVATFQR